MGLRVQVSHMISLFRAGLAETEIYVSVLFSCCWGDIAPTSIPAAATRVLRTVPVLTCHQCIPESSDAQPKGGRSRCVYARNGMTGRHVRSDVKHLEEKVVNLYYLSIYPGMDCRCDLYYPHSPSQNGTQNLHLESFKPPDSVPVEEQESLEIHHTPSSSRSVSPGRIACRTRLGHGVPTVNTQVRPRDILRSV